MDNNNQQSVGDAKVTIEAKVIRANGSEENLGVVAKGTMPAKVAEDIINKFNK